MYGPCIESHLLQGIKSPSLVMHVQVRDMMSRWLAIFLRYCTVDSCLYEYQRLVSRLFPLAKYTVVNEALIGGTQSDHSYITHVLLLSLEQ